jgi:hypothetical protein
MSYKSEIPTLQAFRNGLDSKGEGSGFPPERKKMKSNYSKVKLGSNQYAIRFWDATVAAYRMRSPYKLYEANSELRRLREEESRMDAYLATI